MHINRCFLQFFKTRLKQRSIKTAFKQFARARLNHDCRVQSASAVFLRLLGSKKRSTNHILSLGSANSLNEPCLYLRSKGSLGIVARCSGKKPLYWRDEWLDFFQAARSQFLSSPHGKGSTVDRLSLLTWNDSNLLWNRFEIIGHRCDCKSSSGISAVDLIKVNSLWNLP